MDQCMARSSSLDLSKARKITALEVAVAVFELPQCRFLSTGVKDVTHCHK